MESLEAFENLRKVAEAYNGNFQTHLILQKSLAAIKELIEKQGEAKWNSRETNL